MGVMVQNISGTPSYLFEADVVASAPYNLPRNVAHGYNFQPLSFNSDGSINSLNCDSSASFSVTLEQGTNSSTTAGFANVTGAADYASPDLDYYAECELGPKTFYQTWTASKAGRLTEAGVNVAAFSPTANLSLTLFRYTNDSVLLAPFYVWETLQQVDVPMTNLSTGFAVARIGVQNSTSVAVGDKLGLAVSNGPLGGLGVNVPMCYLLAYTSNRTSNLYVDGIGQVSPRGFNSASPVYEASGQVLKYYATVE